MSSKNLSGSVDDLVLCLEPSEWQLHLNENQLVSDAQLARSLQPIVTKHDVVLAADFGEINHFVLKTVVLDALHQLAELVSAHSVGEIHASLAQFIVSQRHCF